jgi:hypothetical protein
VQFGHEKCCSSSGSDSSARGGCGIKWKIKSVLGESKSSTGNKARSKLKYIKLQKLSDKTGYYRQGAKGTCTVVWDETELEYKNKLQLLTSI